jgi:predicted CxxxxCH...CXXCH cytochrome family protein
VDGKVDLKTAFNDNTATTKTLTQVCNPCHGSGVATAKGNWDAAAAAECLTCHGSTAAYTYANATGRIAPNTAGDNSTYGSNVRGHNRPTASGAYPVTGNAAANLTCGQCHKYTLQHINNVADNSFAGDRLQDNVNNVTGLSTITGLCGACHTTAGSSPVQKLSSRGINTHGNAGYPLADRLEAIFPDRTCDQCHEPHGMVNVSAAPAGVNIWMINPTITVAPGVTVSPVRLYAKSGANSFDNTGTSSDLCRACHANASNPGFPTAYNAAGQHASPGYARDERGRDCSGCHAHNQDGIIATVDGLMPLPCNACHSYPGLDNAASPKQMSAGHRKHAGQPGAGGDTTNTKGYDCSLCHYNYTHNDSGLVKGQAWPATYYDNVNVNFDTSWNPGGTTYRGLAVPTTGNGGTGACAGLYCHGGNSTLNAGWGGSSTAPAWNVTLACGTCHDTGTGDTTPGSVYGTKNHPIHLDNVAQLHGPETWRLMGSGMNCSDGTGCHTRYDLAPVPGGLHANNAKDLRSTATDNGYVAQALAGTQACRNCHSTYTSANIPTSGDALARTQANWDNNAYLLPCITCHNGGSGTQSYANLNGTGGQAHSVEGTYFASGHGLYGFPAPLNCVWCHNTAMGHIGASRPVATNPWRIGISSFTALGRMDSYCSTDICHGSAVPNNHPWIENGAGYTTAKEATDTHPTTAASVPAGKDRWFQVPPSVHVPLFGNLLDNNYNKSGGANNYVLCVSCHDPHGVAATPLPSTVRAFSGQNTDAKGNKMLRFNYSTGVPTPLCAECHK